MTGELSLTNAVVGCSDLDGSARFWQALGFTVMTSERVPAELAATLYGRPRPVETLKVSVPGSAVGWLRLVAAEGSPRAWGPYMKGRSLLELFTRDLDGAESVARSAGGQVVARTEFTRGESRNRELRLIGPDEVEIGLTESNRNRPSAVDSGRDLSELTTIVWFVESVEAALAGSSDLEVHSDSSMEAWTPAHDFLSVPDPAPAVRTAYLGEAGAPLARLQLLELIGHPLESVPSWPIRPGNFAVGCQGTVAMPTTIEHPGGIRFEIWPAEVRPANL